MSGNILGGFKARDTNRDKYGADFYRRIGAQGGSVKNPLKGFGTDKRTMKDKIMGVPKLASLAGQKGGTISRRGNAKLQD